MSHTFHWFRPSVTFGTICKSSEDVFLPISSACLSVELIGRRRDPRANYHVRECTVALENNLENKTAVITFTSDAKGVLLCPGRRLDRSACQGVYFNNNNYLMLVRQEPLL